MSQIQDNLNQFGASGMTSVATAAVADPATPPPLRATTVPPPTTMMMDTSMPATETFVDTVEEPRSGAGEKLANSARKIGQGNILIVLVLIVAAAALYILREWKVAPGVSSAEARLMEATVDSAILQLGQAGASARAADVEKVVNAFYARAERRQIPLGDLGRNPFQFQAGLMPPPTAGTTDPARQGPPPPQEVQDLKLQSILIGQSGNSIAMINNNMLTVGQTIRGWTVKEIHLRKVILEYKGRIYELKQEKLLKRKLR